jgi:Flp pilus assembly protein TadD
MAAAAEALLLAHRGELEQAEALARTAVATAETRTDNVLWQAATHEDLATVLERAGRIDEARAELERTLTIWERKGCLPCAQRVRDRIAALGQETVPSGT